MAESASRVRIETSAEAVELLRQLRRHIVLRWVAISGILAVAVFACVVFNIGLAWEPLLAVTAAIAAYNLAFAWWARREEWLAQRGRAFANVQIVADLLALTALLHFTGGIENPFFLFYFIHIALGSVLLPARDIYRITALAVGMFAALGGTEYIGWLPHMHLPGFLPIELYNRPAYVVALLGAFGVTLGMAAVAATRVVAELQQRRAEQAAARQRELEQVQTRLAELDRMREFFLALASHDLKTPLAVAINYIQTILDGYKGEIAPQQRRWLARAVVRLQELIQLINDFLEVSQLDEVRIAQELQPTDLGEIAQAALNEVMARAKDKEVNLQAALPAGLPLVHGSPKRLQRMLVNLLDNGIKFTPGGGQVTLTLAAEPDCVRIEVADTGVGIPAQYLPHVFEDYFRLRREEFVPGAGLGLSTARRIVEAHGGKVGVESPYRPDNSGTKFTCCLRRAPANALGEKINDH
jgi:signal transduction histidine kinase